MYGEAKMRLLGTYHFCVAFENSRREDYLTEKVFQALAAGCVPLYLGAPGARSLLPANSTLFADDFKTPRDLALHMEGLVASGGYWDMLAWKRRRKEVAKLEKLRRIGSDTGWCRLCKAVQRMS